MLNALKMTVATPLLAAGLCPAQDLAAVANPAQPVAAAAISQPSTSVVTLEPTDNLHIIIRRGFRIKGPGQQVVGEVTQPVFHGEQQVIAPGAVIHGHIATVESMGNKVRAEHLLNGDLTPPRYATVSFDELILPDGQHVQLATNTVQGIDGLHMSLWQTKGEKESLKTQAKTEFHHAIAAPNKMQRLSQAVVTSLPYHPNYVTEGTAFNASVSAPALIKVNSAATLVPADYDMKKSHAQYLHLRLLTPVTSNASSQHQTLDAVVSEPYYDAQHHLLLAAGTHVDGQVRQVKAAKWLHKQGTVRLDFAAPQLSQDTHPVDHLRVVGVEAQRAEFAAVDKEGGIKATAPKLQQITAPLSLIGPSRAVADNSTVKTGYQRAGEGRKGFGLLGSGAAQASASTAIGLGYYGAAKNIYYAFIARGTDIDLPANTALLVNLDSESIR